MLVTIAFITIYCKRKHNFKRNAESSQVINFVTLILITLIQANLL